MFTEKPFFQVILHTLKLILPEPIPLHVQGSVAIDRPVGLGLMELKTYNLFRRWDIKECEVAGKKVVWSVCRVSVRGEEHEEVIKMTLGGGAPIAIGDWLVGAVQSDEHSPAWVCTGIVAWSLAKSQETMAYLGRSTS